MTPERELIRAKAEFCLATRISPSEYDEMTDYEIGIFIEVANERAKAANR